MKGEGATAYPRRSVWALRSLTRGGLGEEGRPGGGNLPCLGLASAQTQFSTGAFLHSLCCLPAGLVIGIFTLQGQWPRAFLKLELSQARVPWYNAQLRGQGSPACPVLLLLLDSRSSSRAFGSSSLGARAEKELVHGPLAPFVSQGICCSPTDVSRAAGTWSQGWP